MNKSIKLTNQEHEISVPLLENNISAWFAHLSEIQEDNVICKTACRFCNHPARQEFEVKWEQTKNMSAVEKYVQKWAEDNNGTKFSPQTIRNHLFNHYEQQERQIWKKEYLDRIESIMNYKISKDKMFEFIASGLQSQFIDVASNPTLCPAKKSDIMVKISRELSNIFAVQVNLRGDIQGTQLISEKFVKVWTHLITTEKDPNRQKELLEHLEVFKEEMTELYTVVQS